MDRLSLCRLGALLLGGCDPSGDLGHGIVPERLPAGIEAFHQEREALAFELDRLQQEAAARRALGVSPAVEAQPGPEPAARGRP